jgi:hypothetical protein
MSNVKIFRLQTGEDLIAGKSEKSSAEVYHLKKPFVIIPMQKQPGGPVQLQMTAYMPYSDDTTVEMDKTKIMAEVTPKADILNSYNANVGSGIIQAAKPKLITD